MISNEMQHDAASLFSFVDRIASLCKERKGSPSYLNDSLKFFECIGALGDATKSYLSSFSQKIPQNKALVTAHRQRLLNLRINWAELHQFIKPAIDADTLNLPSSLLQAFVLRFNEMAGFEKTSFAVFHVHELNYFMVP